MKKKKEIEEKVLSYVEKHRMLAAGDHVLCGLSGGADSVCLLYLLLAMKKHIPITITAVHVNHRLREEADADEAFAKELCSKLGLPFYREEADVKALAKAEGMTLEEAGRMARYQIFAQLASKLKATKIAVAHHANDQAETLLFHLCRGSGLDGACRNASGQRADHQTASMFKKRRDRGIFTDSRAKLCDRCDKRGQHFRQKCAAQSGDPCSGGKGQQQKRGAYGTDGGDRRTCLRLSGGLPAKRAGKVYKIRGRR